MKYNPRKFQAYLFVLAGFLASLPCAVLAAEESITLTTYYPSPYGVYNEMRLYPHSPATVGCNAAQEGLMYYDNSAANRGLRICKCVNPPSCTLYNWESAGGWSLTGNAGTNPATNFIGTTDARDWAIRTNNTERVRVTVSGDVGIGTTDPLQLRLYLNANVPTPAGRNGMQISTPLGHYVGLGGGIGTDGSNTAGLHIGNQAGLNYGGEGGTFYYDYDPADHTLVAASTGGIRIAALGQYPPVGRDIIFSTNPSNIERMRITDGGNVGIGTTSPASPAPNGQVGNLDVNDIYLRSTNKWVSQSGAMWKIASSGVGYSKIEVPHGSIVTVSVPGINVKHVVLGSCWHTDGWRGCHGLSVVEMGSGYFKLTTNDTPGHTNVIESWLAIGD